MRQNEPFELPRYEQIATRYDPDRRALWVLLDPAPRPCFTLTLLRELRDVQERAMRIARDCREPRYFVLASAHPEAFSLGGDLDLFEKIIRSRERDALQSYADLCIDCVYGFHRELRAAGATTIALVQSRALGGGFEAALACNVLIAERSARFGLPEIKFNLFPGMGAVSFLERRVGAAHARRLLTDGEQHGAEALAAMGLVHALAEDGEGLRRVDDYIRRSAPRRDGLSTILEIVDDVNPLTRAELQRIVDIWVDRALELGEPELRTMRKLVSAQSGLVTRSHDAGPTLPGVQATHEVHP
jgi:DSF synthase